MIRNPTVTVGALLVNHDRKVLMGLRAAWKSAWPGHWDTIGGRVEAGETLEEALVREIQEEIGVTPTDFGWMRCIGERHPELYGKRCTTFSRSSAGKAGIQATFARNTPRSGGLMSRNFSASPIWWIAIIAGSQSSPRRDLPKVPVLARDPRTDPRHFP
ncbi:NUDIX domain-containing protein [Mesorhizobium sp. M1300]|uniref:NUDIX hydrolase n=1 Tax=Mesorhizobium sp. M1300 TaxID=2957077 RepID=UPI00333AFEC7